MWQKVGMKEDEDCTVQSPVPWGSFASIDKHDSQTSPELSTNQRTYVLYRIGQADKGKAVTIPLAMYGTIAPPVQLISPLHECRRPTYWWK